MNCRTCHQYIAILITNGISLREVSMIFVCCTMKKLTWLWSLAPSHICSHILAFDYGPSVVSYQWIIYRMMFVSDGLISFPSRYYNYARNYFLHHTVMSALLLLNKYHLTISFVLFEFVTNVVFEWRFKFSNNMSGGFIHQFNMLRKAVSVRGLGIV